MTVPTTAGAVDTSRRWLRRPRPRHDPAARLVCLPHAGGTASAYTSWAALLPPRIELLAVQYPGRQDRLTEPCAKSIVEIVAALLPVLAPYAERPLYLFGHSMGGLVAYELAVRLEAGPGPDPAGLFVSSQLAPHRSRPVLEALDDAIVEAEARAYGWSDPAVFEHPELRELVLPALLADVRAALSHHPRPVRLRCPIVAYGATGDPGDVTAELAAWGELSGRPAAWRRFDGDHFYLHSSQRAELVADIVARMSN